MDESLRIERLPGETVRFRLSASPDGPAKALMITLRDAETEEVLWWLVNDPGGGEWQTLRVSSVRAAEYGTVDSLPAEHPDRRFVETMMAESLEASHGVGELEYGVVPAGYHQATPDQGTPAPLKPGKRYTLAVWGAPSGGLIFEA